MEITLSEPAAALELLARLPSPEEILALRPSEELQQRISALLEKNRAEGLTDCAHGKSKSAPEVEGFVRKISCLLARFLNLSQ